MGCVFHNRAGLLSSSPLRSATDFYNSSSVMPSLCARSAVPEKEVLWRCLFAFAAAEQFKYLRKKL